MKRYSLYIFGVSVEERKNEAKDIFEEKIMKNSQRNRFKNLNI